MDRGQFVTHVEATQKAFRRFLVALCCGDSALADDIAQEAYIKAYLSCDSVGNPEKFKSSPMEEDDMIKDLFHDFQPEISPSAPFMDNLRRNLEAVEIVKRHNQALKRRNKLAIAIAAACGFAMGLIIAPFLPLVEAWAAGIIASFTSLPISGLNSAVSWIVAASACMLTSLNTYEIAMATLTAKERASSLLQHK